MAQDDLETTAAFHELLDFVRDGTDLFLTGDREVTDPVSRLEGHRWLTEVLSVALECYLHADAARPSLVDIVGPTRKWGGDNADAYYRFAPVDPDRTYKVRCKIGDAVYLSFVVYGGPDDGRWSTRIVSKINSREITFEPDGRSFELVLSAERPEGAANWVPLEPDAVAVLTRDYLVDPVNDTRATYEIEAVPPAPPPGPLTDADLAARFRRATAFLRELTGIMPLGPPPEPEGYNAFDEPYAQADVTYGWAAADATYCMGRFRLTEDEALVIEGRSPDCAFWNLCLWNPYLQTYDYRYLPVTINGGQAEVADDGSWRIVVSETDPGVPNWLCTAGHREGLLWFRWFLAAELPPRPTTFVVKTADL